MTGVFNYFQGLKKEKKFLIGRGEGSGVGKTAKRGVKGQRARSGGTGSHRLIGGQQNLYTALPKRGFSKHFRKPTVVAVPIERLIAVMANDTDSTEKKSVTVNRDFLLTHKFIKPNFLGKVKFIGSVDYDNLKLIFEKKSVLFSKKCQEFVLGKGSEII